MHLSLINHDDVATATAVTICYGARRKGYRKPQLLRSMVLELLSNTRVKSVSNTAVAQYAHAVMFIYPEVAASAYGDSC